MSDPMELPASSGLTPSGVKRATYSVDFPFGLFDAQAVLPFVDESGTGVHGTHKVVHIGNGRIRRLDHEINTLVKHVEVKIRRYHGDLAQFIVENIQAGHFAIDPNQSRTFRRIRFAVMCVNHLASFPLRVRVPLGTLQLNIRRYREVGRLEGLRTGKSHLF